MAKCCAKPDIKLVPELGAWIYNDGPRYKPLCRNCMTPYRAPTIEEQLAEPVHWREVWGMVWAEVQLIPIYWRNYWRR